MRIIFLLLLFFNLSPLSLFSQTKDTIIDSQFSWAELQIKLRAHYFDSSNNKFSKREKQSIGELINTGLTLVNVVYIGFDKQVHKGQLICDQSVADNIRQIFFGLLQMRFPIRQCKPINEFGYSDIKSMQADNTTCFDFRLKTGSRQLSKHAYGLAIDINPVENPYKKNNEILPANSNENALTGRIRITEEQGKKVIAIFKRCGWMWGGSWLSLQDYMHFEKR